MTEEMEELIAPMTSTLMPRKVREKIMAECAPVEIARALYEKAGLDFDADFNRCLLDGFVIARPWLFMMFRAVQLEQGPAWHIKVATGNVPEMIGLLPFYLPFVAFQRRADSHLRVIPLERAAKIALRMMKR